MNEHTKQIIVQTIDQNQRGIFAQNTLESWMENAAEYVLMMLLDTKLNTSTTTQNFPKPFQR